MEETKSNLRSKLDLFFWAVVIILLSAGIFANHYFRDLAWSLRLVVWIFLLAFLCWLAMLTAQGKKMWAFIKSARIELYKVVWPTRDETIKTTAIVAALVFAMSILLWLLDSVLLRVVNWFTN